MTDFFMYSVFWILSIYGLIEILKNIYYIVVFTKLKTNGIYLIIAGKEQEDKIEIITRSLLFKLLYSGDDNINNIILTDLNSKDKTGEIMEKLEKNYQGVKYMKWKNCKELLEGINKVE